MTTIANDNTAGPAAPKIETGKHPSVGELVSWSHRSRRQSEEPACIILWNHGAGFLIANGASAGRLRRPELPPDEPDEIAIFGQMQDFLRCADDDGGALA